MVRERLYSISGEAAYQSYLDEARRLLDSEIADLMSNVADLRIFTMMQYVLLTRGKRLRPLLVMLSAQSVGGRRENVKQLALAIELLHAATLVHDDILDQDSFRRGALAVHAKWPVKDAILVGDALASLAFNLASDYGSEILKIMSATALTLCDGECMDVDMTIDTISEADYFEMIKKKSASLFKAAAWCGAIAEGGSAREIKSLTQFGENLGIAYQVRDDLSDVASLKNKLSQDLRECRATLPLIHLYQLCDEAERTELLENLAATANNEQVEKAILTDNISRNLEIKGSFSYCQRKVDQHIEQAIANLESLKTSVFKSYLIEMANSLRSDREKI